MALKRFLGSILSATPPTVGTSGFEDSSASGRWSPSQILSYIADAVWPTQGNVPTYVDDVFSTYLYDGNGSTQTITNGIDLSGEGGMVWLKIRGGSSAPLGHHVYDTERGATKKLRPDNTDAEATVSNGLTSFNSNGFTLGNNVGVNGGLSGDTYVSWSFRKQAGAFDVVTYTGDGSSTRNIAHNLGSAPGMIIVKVTSHSDSWQVYHRSLNDNSGNPYFLQLDSTAAQDTGGGNFTTPSATHFGVRTNINNNGYTYVAYLFAHDDQRFGDTKNEPIIKCDSYSIGSSNNNIEIDVGFEPQWVMIKRTDSAENWIVIDNMRGSVNTNSVFLYPNASNSEYTETNGPYITSTGWSPQGLGANRTYAYVAIRRSMKPPTTATEVFEPNYTSSDQFVTTDFPVDLQFGQYTGGGSTYVVDRMRGMNTSTTGSMRYVTTQSTSAEASNTGSLGFNGFVQDGFSHTLGSYNQRLWSFKRATNFMDIVTYIGTGSNRTISHALGITPSMVVVRNRTTAGYSWQVWHSGYSVYSTPTGNLYMRFNSDSAIAADATIWNGTEPTASEFSVGTSSETNRNGDFHTAYLFGEIAGISKLGSYTATGSDMNIDCGFTSGARFILIKRVTPGSGDWFVWDTARGISAGSDPYVYLNSTAAEVTGNDYIDPYSAGFTITSSATWINVNTYKYIFFAVA